MKKITFLAVIALIFSSFAPRHEGLHIGQKAPDFKLKNIDGKYVSMADYKNAKGFIVVFTCNHCPFAKKYEDRIIALDKKYASKGYPVIAINPNDEKASPDDSYDLMKVRAKEKKFAFPYLIDETQEIARKYGATRTPHVFVLQKEEGGLITRYIGAIDDNTDSAADAKEKYVESAVDNLLKAQPVNPDQTKAIGCTIKWRKA